MGTDNVIFVGEQWGATGSHVTETDVTGSRVTARFLNRLYDLACSGVTQRSLFLIRQKVPLHVLDLLSVHNLRQCY
jgi:hypothetical protein